MKRWIVFVVALLAIGCLVEDASAFGRRRSRGSVSYSYSYTGAHMEYSATEAEASQRFNGMTLQEVAQARADAMAASGVLSHEIHLTADVPSWAGMGVGEGIGCASVSDPKSCSTCIVGSRVVADAHARSRSGMVFRVRFFR